MRNTPATLVGLSALLLVAACGGKTAPEQPTPQSTPTTSDDAAMRRARQDSIDAAARARADAEARAKADAEARARSDASGMRTSLMDAITSKVHFDYDKADIRSDDEAALDRKAAILAANSGLRLKIAGNADERGSDEYNLALGNRRGAAAKRYLTSKGVDAGRLEVVSYGEEKPANPGHDEAAYADNRRDDFEITAGGDGLVQP
ncbi:MAG: peptidoglycan-associated lipoprotein Pal [Gemmatimonadota bacterium]